MKNPIKKCKYIITKIEDSKGNPRSDEASKKRINKIGRADVISDTLLFFYLDKLTGFKTSKIQDIKETDEGICVETLNSKYYLEETYV